jgi:TolB-like protein
MCVVALILPAPLLYGSSSAEESSGERAEYLAGQGIIVEPRDVEVWEFISTIDYGYPEPEGDLGVYAYPGQYQLSPGEQEMLLSIGVQAARTSLADLPPLNIAFVVDTSGSMDAANKISWVRDSLEVFEASVRDTDSVSIVSFNNDASVVLPGTRMQDGADRRRFLSAASSLRAGGSTNLYAGLELGFAQLLAQLSSENVNRIILLSDGLPTAGIQDPREFERLARSYRDLGVSISAIGLGTEADLALIRDIAHWSSGTSRFINNRETMEETFGSGLGRLIVPVAQDVVVDVRLAPGVQVAETWGYDHRIVGDTLTYTVPALHDSDYETMVAILEVPATTRTGEQRIATIETSYRAGSGVIEQADRVLVSVERVELERPVTGVTDAMALRAAMMLGYGQVIVEVGQRYYDERSRTASGGIAPDTAEALLGVVTDFKYEMENAQLRLDEPVFEQELGVLSSYQDILAEELQIAQAERQARYAKLRHVAPVPDRAIEQHVDSLVLELRLSMRHLHSGSIAILGFTGLGDVDPEIQELLADATRESVSRLPGFTLRAVEAMYGPEVSDAAAAARLGRELGVDYVITGMLVASPQTMHFFERVIRSGDGEVLSAAQVMMPR